METSQDSEDVADCSIFFAPSMAGWLYKVVVLFMAGCKLLTS